MDCPSGTGSKHLSPALSASSPNKMSPYSDIVALHFADQVLHVHRFVVETVPKLHAVVAARNEFDMSEVSTVAGHALVSFMYKGSYDPLALAVHDQNSAERSTDLLRSSFDVYKLARKYNMTDLAVLAQEDIESRTDDLDPAEALAAVKKACPLPDANDAWLCSYTKTLLDATYASVEAFLASEIMAAENAEMTISITEMLLRTVIRSAKDREAHERQHIEELRAEEQDLREKLARRGKLGKSDRRRLDEIEEELAALTLHHEPQSDPEEAPEPEADAEAVAEAIPDDY
ncbi:uncharacterized protein B0I36DRAFT_358789 [Microdochium trichocladiopsis]|uniref:BTB domain-containing protein n=1 Tax=Microdochium trichocladiopsis TaxID=1682393 RepID=A0A9P8YCY8_9PEZI|nr:uncharacterized protein B0I36DRAFT_358789 [Microdochium trichocladiopsis]KAH7037038.1 hypothetical protein B0I36DRAFT_358789 [Microdochium trichocladiopsis]